MKSIHQGRALLASLLLSVAAYGQFRGGIQGTILDPTGAAVPGAKVTLQDEETSASQETTSGPEGFYRFSALRPARYTITVEMAGFQKAVHEHVVVRAEQLEGLNITLSPGQVTESITVSAESAPPLQTENANIDGALSHRQVTGLPQFQRDPYELLRLAPGIFGLGARDGGGNSLALPNSAGPGGSNNSIFQTENQVPITANGQRLTANGFQIDGVNVNSQAWGGAAIITPSQEAVKEIRVVSSSYSAENGRNTGALIQVVSQNGTNEFHGSFVGRFGRPELNAFQRWGGPRGERPQRVGKSFNQWAGSIGGPIRKNKLFFFFAYERIGSSNSTNEPQWVETEEFVERIRALRPNSIAAQVLTLPGMSPRINRVIPRDCASFGLPDPTRCATLPGGLDIGSPTGAVGQRIANPAGGGLDGLPDIRFVESPFFLDVTSAQYNGRLDYQLSDRDLVAFSSFFVPSDTTFNQSWANHARPVQDWLSSRLNESAALLWTRTFSSTMINEARFNVARWSFDEVKSNPKIPWGIPQSTVADSRFNIQWGVPGPGIFAQTSYNFRDTLTKVVNSHALKFGVDISRELNNDTVAWAARPSFNFDNLWNFANDAPNSESGNFDPRNGHPTDLKKYIRTTTYALFVQDDWKVRPSLTLNLGLRWEYFAPLREKFGNAANIVLGSGGGALTGARMRIGGNFWEPDRNNFGPQFGFAWSPKTLGGLELNHKTVLRGGFGVGFNRVPQSLTLNGRLNPPFFASFFLTGDQVVYSLSTEGINSFTGWPANPAARLVFDSTTNLPVGGANFGKPNIFGLPLNLKTPYAYRYSLEIQQELPGNWVVSAGYQGSAGHKFPRAMNLSLLFDPNPFINRVDFVQTDINSNFNALLLRATHRFSRGFEFNAQYRFSKSIDTCSNDDRCGGLLTFPLDLRTERGPSDFDVTHAFVASGIWQLPWRDRLGSWEIGGIWTANSGFPWTPVVTGDACVEITGRGGICPVRPIAYLGGAGRDTSNRAFQTGSNFPGGGLRFFVPPPGGQTLLPPPPGIGRNVFRGPRYMSVDLTAARRMRLPKIAVLGENASVDLRAFFYNIFNQLNLRPFEFNSPSTQVNNPDFGKALSALAGRVIEFQLRFNF